MTVGAAVVKHLTSMVKHRLCKARNIFSAIFKESARKTGGVPWGVYHEMCEQINRIGPAKIRDKYASICARNNWSEKSSKKFVSVIEDIHDFCIASGEIASLVDIGYPLICETYICESKQPGAFTV